MASRETILRHYDVVWETRNTKIPRHESETYTTAEYRLPDLSPNPTLHSRRSRHRRNVNRQASDFEVIGKGRLFPTKDQLIVAFVFSQKMLPRALFIKFIRKPSTVSLFQFNQQRELHSRNKKAMEFIAKGWNALKEVDRVIDYCELNDRRLIPLLNTAKENFELALEADNTNTHARYWLSRLHMKYHVPGANKAVGAALLVEAAEMGDPDAQYALGCHLRVENDYVHSDQQAFYYLEKAVDQLHPGALYLLGAVYLTGDCVKKDIASALWCFHRASEKGHAGAAIAYGSLLLKGVEIPESLVKFSLKRGTAVHKRGKKKESLAIDPVEMAREKFQIAAKAGCDLGFKWLARLEEEEKRLLTEEH